MTKKIKEKIYNLFCQLGDEEQVDVMVDLYNYIYSIQQDKFRKRVNIDNDYDY